MADLQRLFFDQTAKVSDREVLVAARLNARVKRLMGEKLTEELAARVNAAVLDEMDRLIEDGLLRRRIDWLAVLVGGRLQVAFGTRAVLQLSRELHGAPPA